MSPPGRALVADDQPGVARGVALLLERDYEVDTAGGFEEAARLLESTAYDLVLSDLAMETADAGHRLLALVAQLQPTAMRVLITGGALPTEHGAHVLLAKPFDLAQLRKALSDGR